MAQKAASSFRFFHPDIDCHLFEDNRILERVYNGDWPLYRQSPGLRKIGFVHFLMAFLKYDKVICLGADTITAARLDEFIECTSDLGVALNYPYKFVNSVTGTESPDDETHINSDVCVFQNIDAVQNILEEGVKNESLWEQAGINEIIWSDKYNYSYTIVDYPYDKSEVIYNVRAKGNICDYASNKPWGPYINQWYIKDDKLFSHDNKQIKVVHYCEGFFAGPKNRVEQILDTWWNTYFSADVKGWLEKL